MILGWKVNTVVKLDVRPFLKAMYVGEVLDIVSNYPNPIIPEVKLKDGVIYFCENDIVIDFNMVVDDGILDDMVKGIQDELMRHALEKLGECRGSNEFEGLDRVIRASIT